MSEAIRYFWNGREVTAKEHARLMSKHSRLKELFESGKAPATHSPATWPMVSESMAVHPSQIQEAMAEDRKHGVPVDYLPDGRVVYTSPRQRKAHMEKHGFFDKNGGYADPAPSSVSMDTSKPDTEDRPD